MRRVQAKRVATNPTRGASYAPLLGVTAAVFEGAVRARQILYSLGVWRSRRADGPVISVGNITVGGNGKTPMTIFLANRLGARGLSVAVVSRGYGAKVKARAPKLVGEEGRVLLDATEAGDEPVLIAQKTKASVIVSADRVLGARYAFEHQGADVVLLDDGFQHWPIERDLDVVMVDGEEPFGNGRLLPAGTLREPSEALSRADLLVVHRGHQAWRSLGRLTGMPEQIPQVEVAMMPTSIGPLFGGFRQPAATLEGKRVALLAAIARPERFHRAVQGLGVHSIVHEHYLRDHAFMSAAELSEFVTRARQRGAEYLLTTEKDAARLMGEPGAAPLFTLSLELVLLSGEAELEAALEQALGR